jgi:hypothetical protein
VVIINLNVMAMDNDEALQREDASPTYKIVKGVASLEMVWDPVIVDAVFRAGHHHRKHKDSTEKMVRWVVQLIRRRYWPTVPIVIRQAPGFFDQKLLDLYEALGVAYLSGGKLHKSIKKFVAKYESEVRQTNIKGEPEWSYVEFGDRRKAWERFLHAVFCHTSYTDRLILLDLGGPYTMVYTNLDMGSPVDRVLLDAGAGHLFEARGKIGNYHGRGSDKVVRWAQKDFVSCSSATIWPGCAFTAIQRPSESNSSPEAVASTSRVMRLMSSWAAARTEPSGASSPMGGLWMDLRMVLPPPPDRSSENTQVGSSLVSFDGWEGLYHCVDSIQKCSGCLALPGRRVSTLDWKNPSCRADMRALAPGRLRDSSSLYSHCSQICRMDRGTWQSLIGITLSCKVIQLRDCLCSSGPVSHTRKMRGAW